MVLGSDPCRLHGAVPKLILVDEVAQWPENLIDRMLAALETSRGKIPDSKMLWLGTRASSPDHPFEAAFKLVGYAQVHAARKTDPAFQRRTWKKANPGLDRQPDLEKAIRQEAERAKKDPSALARFKALRLNLGVSDTVESVLLDFESWERIEADAPETAGPFVLGLDLGQNAAMSAAAALPTVAGSHEWSPGNDRSGRQCQVSEGRPGAALTVSRRCGRSCAILAVAEGRRRAKSQESAPVFQYAIV